MAKALQLAKLSAAISVQFPVVSVWVVTRSKWLGGSPSLVSQDYVEVQTTLPHLSISQPHLSQVHPPQSN